MAHRTRALAAATLLLLAGCAAPAWPAETPSADDGANVHDYCSAVHRVREVTAEGTADGVVVRWDSLPTGDPVDYVVHRRAVGTEGWERLAEVTIDDSAEMSHLDADPAPGNSYEYTVTRHEPDCGGENPLCADGLCDPAPSASRSQG